MVREPDLADAKLEMVGDGEARPALERLVETLGIGESVRFHGYLQPRDFVPILARCRITVSPDPPTPFNAISTMVKVVDSLVIGRAVVSFDLAETHRLTGEAGRVVDPPDAGSLAATIVELLRNPEEAARLGAIAAEQARKLNLGWEHSAHLLLDAYRDLLGDRAARLGAPD